jgi:putrescine transport system permease protein
VIDGPLPLIYNDFAVYLGIVYSYLPFMILPLYANLERLDLDLHDAAADLGARRWQVFIDVTLPLSLPGIIAGCLLVFIPAIGEFVIPALLGGADTLMIGRVLWDEFFVNRDWPVASAVSVVLLFILILPLIWFQQAQARHDSRLVTLWGGFSLRWYQVLLQNEDVLAAALLSLRIAAVSATLATALGTLVGLALDRLGQFKGRLLLTGMITSPLVMPEIITGISLLFLFITLADWIGWPQSRGANTITIAHVTFSMAYVAVIVRSRLSGMNQDLEEAAMDLGGRPLRVFFDVTVPMITPAMVAGWLLAFTLSLDDLVIASFVSGPGSTTLPMLIFSKVRLGVTPDINALATVIIVFVSIGVITAGLIMRHQERRSGAIG